MNQFTPLPPQSSTADSVREWTRWRRILVNLPVVLLDERRGVITEVRSITRDRKGRRMPTKIEVMLEGGLTDVVLLRGVKATPQPWHSQEFAAWLERETSCG